MPHCVGTKQFNSTYFIAYIKFNERWQRPRQLCKYLQRKSHFIGIKFDKSTYWTDSYDEKIHFFQLVLFDERFLPNFVFTFFNSFMLTCSWYVVNLTLNETNVNALSTEKMCFMSWDRVFYLNFLFKSGWQVFVYIKSHLKKYQFPMDQISTENATHTSHQFPYRVRDLEQTSASARFQYSLRMQQI